MIGITSVLTICQTEVYSPTDDFLWQVSKESEWLISTFIGICYSLTDAKLFTRVKHTRARTHMHKDTHTCAHIHTH